MIAVLSLLLLLAAAYVYGCHVGRKATLTKVEEAYQRGYDECAEGFTVNGW